LKGLRDAAAGVADAFRNAFDRANEYFRLVAEKGSLNVSLEGFQPKRAGGGRVTGGMPYLVGEMGPELFMPGRGGNIVPNDGLGRGGGGNTYNVTINANVADSRLGEVVVNAIKRYERNSGPVFARA
jgi:hypothetical protein